MRKIGLTNGLRAAAPGAVLFERQYAEQPFAGRQRELAALDSWLDEARGPALVLAPAGGGKSALLYAWSSGLGDGVLWVPICQRFGLAKTEVVRQMIGARLNVLGYRSGATWTDRIAAHSQRTIVVVDGLDELLDAEFEHDLWELQALVNDVKLVVAARIMLDCDASYWRQRVAMDHTRRDEVYVLDLGPLERSAIERLLPPELSSEERANVARMTGGDPLTARLFADALRGESSPRLATELLGGIASVLPTLDGDHRLYGNREAVANVLARALGATSEELLAAVSGQSVTDVIAGLHDLRRLLVRDEARRVAFSHPRIADYFSDRLSDEARSQIDAAWVCRLAELFKAVVDGSLRGAAAATVVERYRVHLERVQAPLASFGELIDHRWLEAWEEYEGGTTGFMGDLLAVWYKADAALALEWSDDVCVLQMKCSSLAAVLVQSEANLSAHARAAAVRLQLRSATASVLSLTAITDNWKHRAAVAELLEVLDDRGFDLLLDAAGTPDPLRWPTVGVVNRLLRLGHVEEALRWARELKPNLPELAEVARLFREADAPAGALETLRVVARSGLPECGDDSDAAEWVEDHVAAAQVFEAAERKACLLKALTVLEAGDNGLFWDELNGEEDPRLVLAGALHEEGLFASAQALRVRVRRNPYPFARRGESITLEAPCEPIGEDDLADLPDTSSQEGEPFLSVDALDGLLAILQAHLLAPQQDRDWENVSRILRPLGLYARQYDAERAARASRLLWQLAQELPPQISWWQVLAALMPTLLRAGQEGRECAQDLYQRACNNLTLIPDLCVFPEWTQLFTEEQQRDYVSVLLRRRVIGNPVTLVRTLLKLSTSVRAEDTSARTLILNRERIARLALEAARADEGWRELPAVAEAFPECWEEIIKLVVSASKPVSIYVLSELSKVAPSGTQGAELCRWVWARHYSTAIHCSAAAELLSSLPLDEAEVMIDRMARDGAKLDSLGFMKLAQSLLERVLAHRLSAARSAGMYQRASLLSDWQILGAHPELSAEFDAVLDWLRTQLSSTIGPPAVHAGPESAVFTSVLGRLLQCSSGTVLDELEPAIRELGDADVIHQYNHQRQKLGQPDLQIDGAGPLDELDVLADALAKCTGGSQLAGLLCGLPEFEVLTYPWVHTIIAEQGLAAAFADYLLATEALLHEPRIVLRAMVGVWDALSAEERRRLEPALEQAMDSDRSSGQQQRFLAVPLLSAATLRRQWQREMRHQRERRRFGLVDAYSAPLGLAEAHANALSEVASWFLPGS